MAYQTDDFIIKRNPITGKYAIKHVTGFPCEGEHDTVAHAKREVAKYIRMNYFPMGEPGQPVIM